MTRVGIGLDVHAMAPDRPLVLGGVTLSSDGGLAGHSDADVLTHAVCDALLGAAGEGDLGRHFPSSEARWRDVSSLQMLSRVAEMVRTAGWEVTNIDAVVVAEQPRLAGHLRAMAAALADCLGVEAARVHVKATSTDGLGTIGR
ncbi:MAG: 2-C-methyl-D-erythritol 2,4-cyclodiphosphate synthase, partial [Acidobacteriota bacterium]